MKLNCDLGESFGQWQLGNDPQVMPHIDQANIACGFHAGDPLVILTTLKLAKQHHVSIGAHPSYPDIVGFGRRSMTCSHDEIIAFMLYQIAALDGMAKSIGMSLNYVKPHGALYNDMMSDNKVLIAILSSLNQYNQGRHHTEAPLKLMLQASNNFQEHQQHADHYQINLLAEAFADRAYDDDGKLLSRKLEGAVLSKENMLIQVKQLIQDGTVTTHTGKVLKLHVDSLCVHGDNIEGINAIEEIKILVTNVT